MSQDCFHQTLICLQKICVDNLKKKKKKFAIQTRSNKNVCVCLCVYLCVLRADIEPSRYVARARVCVRARLAGLPALCQASIPASHHASLSAFLFQSLDVFHLSSSPFSLPASFIHLNSPMSVCVPHTLTFDTHTPSNTIFTLSL